MARSSDLEARVRALLDRHRDRRPLTWRAASATAALACTVLLPAAAFTARAQAARPESAAAAAPAPAPSPAAQPLPEPEPKPAAEPQSESGAIYGAVRDPSNSVVPNCGVSAMNLENARTETAVTNAAGGYRLAVPPGRYALEVRAPGFAIARREVVVAAGDSTQGDFNLELGRVSEEIRVTARKPTAAAPAPASAHSQRTQVGGNVQECKLIRMVRPAYPEDLRLAGTEGTVVVRAIISKDGDVLNPQALSADIDARLVQAALDAVRQWKYSPTLLNGQPVETLTEIAVAFSLQ
jgi:TonB family protein